MMWSENVEQDALMLLEIRVQGIAWTWQKEDCVQPLSSRTAGVIWWKRLLLEG